MEPTTQTYRKLPGTRRTPFRKATLWLSTDHILAVDSHRFVEEYKRYYFKDIQAIIVRQTGSTALSTALDLLVALVTVLLALLAWQFRSYGTGVAAGIVLGVWLIFRSPGRLCSCHIVTAVSRDRLHSLSRLRKADEALRILAPLIDQAQREPGP